MTVRVRRSEGEGLRSRLWVGVLEMPATVLWVGLVLLMLMLRVVVCWCSPWCAEEGLDLVGRGTLQRRRRAGRGSMHLHLPLASCRRPSAIWTAAFAIPLWRQLNILRHPHHVLVRRRRLALRIFAPLVRVCRPVHPWWGATTLHRAWTANASAHGSGSAACAYGRGVRGVHCARGDAAWGRWGVR